MTDAHEDEPQPPASPPGSGPRRRKHRRATGGAAATPSDPGSVLPGRSADDQDTGWGERPGPDDDERFLREVPPHW